MCSARLGRDLAEQEALEADQQDADWIADAKAVAALAQELMTDLTAVPQGATSSPLVAAVVEEFLTDDTSRYLLVVRPAGSSASQLVSDRPLAMKDPVHLTATAASRTPSSTSARRAPSLQASRPARVSWWGPSDRS